MSVSVAFCSALFPSHAAGQFLKLVSHAVLYGKCLFSVLAIEKVASFTVFCPEEFVIELALRLRVAAQTIHCSQ